MTTAPDPTPADADATPPAPDAPADPAAGPALDYAPAPSPWRRVLRRVRRWWPAGLLLAVAVAGSVYGPRAWRRYQLLKLQDACLTAAIPRDRPLAEYNPAAGAAQVAARPGEYVFDRYGRAVRADPRWAALAAEVGVGPWPGGPPTWPLPTAFCHERWTPDGRRRLVVVEGWAFVTVVEPAGWRGGGPRVAWRDVIDSNVATLSEHVAGSALYDPHRVRAGVPDPADRSRFTVPFVNNGVAGAFEYRLGDDDRVTMRLLDPAGFEARAGFARAYQAPTERPASGPATRPASRPAPPEGK